MQLYSTPLTDILRKYIGYLTLYGKKKRKQEKERNLKYVEISSSLRKL